MRNPVGLFPLVWSFATADSTFLLCLETQWLAQALWGQGSKINSMHREASAHVRRKAPQQGSVCYSLHQELNSLQALRETIHTNSCCPLSLGSPHKHYHEKSKLKSFGVFGFGVFFVWSWWVLFVCWNFFNLLSWNYFLAVLQLYAPEIPDFLKSVYSIPCKQQLSCPAPNTLLLPAMKQRGEHFWRAGNHSKPNARFGHMKDMNWNILTWNEFCKEHEDRRAVNCYSPTPQKQLFCSLWNLA